MLKKRRRTTRRRRRRRWPLWRAVVVVAVPRTQLSRRCAAKWPPACLLVLKVMFCLIRDTFLSSETFFLCFGVKILNTLGWRQLGSWTKSDLG
jgi:hypothetical protein